MFALRSPVGTAILSQLWHVEACGLQLCTSAVKGAWPTTSSLAVLRIAGARLVVQVGGKSGGKLRGLRGETWHWWGVGSSIDN